ncbi:unnamed protein product [Mesocestoides corti]|nr:unnamed protein product [Mesocestoides corti]
MDFLTPNLDVLAMPLDVAYPAGVSTTYSLFEGGRGEGGEGIFPLSPAYVRLLDRRNINGTSSTAAAATTTTVTPSLAWTSRHWPQAWAAATLIASLLPHLCLYAPDSLPGVLLRRFLSSIHTCLIASATPSQSPMTTCIHLLFQTNHMRDHCSSLLLFAIGRLAAFEDGAALLQSLGFPESLLTLTIGNEKNRSEYRPVNVKETINNQRFLCSKILLASMDYSGPGIGRSLLVSICSWGHNALRLFATKFIRLLLRLKIPGTQSWCVPLLVTLSFDPDPKVVYEAVSVLEEACLDPVSVQILLDHLHPDKKSTGTAFQAANRCCAAFPSPVLHLLSIAGFSSQRIVACLLASSPWMFKLFSTPKSSTVRTLGAYYRSNIVGTPLEYMLQAWLEVYNEEYSRSIESLLQNNFRLHQSPVGVPTTHIGLPSLKLCPACNQSIRSATATLRAPGDQDDDEHFLNRQSNRFFTPFSADSEEGRDVVVELSPVAKQFFFETSHTFVPIHLFSCLASHEAGFRVLLEHGHLQDLADRISLHHHQLPATEGAKPSMTNASPVEVKAAIWALSHVLVTRNGACWARAPGIVDDLFRLTTHAESLSVRG